MAAKRTSKKAAPTREALEAMAKKDLVSRAEALKVDGAKRLTKLELVDEIVRVQGTEARGLLGKARDLIKGVVEKGIAKKAKPNGEAKSNGHALQDEKMPDEKKPAAPVATTTLAEIYLAQGHVARAKAIVREVLRNVPDDARALALMAKMEGPHAPAAPVVAAPAAAVKLSSAPRDSGPDSDSDSRSPDDPYSVGAIEAEAFVEAVIPGIPAVPSMLDDAPFPERYDVDECVALAVDPTTVYVYFETRARTRERAIRALGGGDATSTLRVLIVEANAQGPQVSTRDFEVIDLSIGEWFVRELPPGAIVRAAIGVKVGERFLPIAHTLDVEAPAASPSGAIARELALWTEKATLDPSDREEMTDHVRARPLAVERRRDEALVEAAQVPLEPGPGDAPFDESLGLSSAELASWRARAERAARAARGRREGLPGSSDRLR